MQYTFRICKSLQSQPNPLLKVSTSLRKKDVSHFLSPTLPTPWLPYIFECQGRSKTAERG